MKDEGIIEFEVPFEVGSQLRRHSEKHHLHVMALQDSSAYKVMLFISEPPYSCKVCKSDLGPFKAGDDLCSVCWSNLPWQIRHAWLAWFLVIGMLTILIASGGT